MSDINVCLSCDDNYSTYAGVTIASILTNANPSDKLNFYILDGEISDEHKQEILSLKKIKDCNIKFVKVDSAMFEDYAQIQTHKYITIPAYYRLKLSSLIPEVDKIIYFDCDTVVNSSLEELFNTNTDNYLMAGVLDINKQMLKKNPTYVNSGVLVFDLKNMRKENVEDEFLNWTKNNFDKIKVGDQQIINEVCRGRIKIVDDTWNVQSSNFTNRSSYIKNPNIVHYVSKRKPWRWISFSYHRNLYFKYLQLTPWKLSEKDLIHWTRDNQILSLLLYFKRKPLFFLRPKFYKAVYETYIKK
ncbi:glycosyltransferase family 8 protein [bacterium]|nr:glycosyltransferase family 8 protein [bacterium]